MNFCSRVACSFIKRAIDNGKTNNIVVSPLNINAVISIISQGSSSKGKVLNAFLRTEGPDPFPSVFNNSNVRVVNRIFMDKSLPVDSWYPQIMLQKYRAFIHQVNFKDESEHENIEELIDYWAKEDTGGLIRKVIERSSLSTSVRLVMLNALYYKGMWLHRFKSTENLQFHTIGGNTEKTTFMTGTSFFHKKFDRFDLIRIPYEDDVSMYIYLPDDIDVLKKFLGESETRTKNHIHFLCQDFELERSESYDSLWLPKFRISYRTMGLPNFLKDVYWSDLSNLPFSNISDDGDLFTYKLAHHCEIRVDEEGTEAASGTLKMMDTRGWPKKKIVVDKPFLFMIRDDATKVILFVGVVMNPNEDLSC